MGTGMATGWVWDERRASADTLPSHDRHASETLEAPA